MSEATVAIVVAIIGFVGTMISVFVSSKSVRDSVTNQLDKKMAVIETRMESMDKKIEEHNGYAKMFQEKVPLIEYKLSQLGKNEDK